MQLPNNLRHFVVMAQRTWTWLALLATLWLAPAAYAASPLTHERFTLDNGLDVVLHTDRRLPLVAVDLSYHVGSMHDGDSPGVAHLVEHLMFRGSRLVEDGEHDRMLFDAGALGTNASTDRERTSYTTVVPRATLPLALWLESERMGWLRASSSPSRVEQEKKTTTDEWDMLIHSEQHGMDGEHLWTALFPPGHPLAHENSDQIARITVAQTEAFVERYYGPGNATLVLAGDLPENTRALVTKSFSRNRGGERPATPARLTETPTKEQPIEVHSRLAAAPSVVMAWPTAALYEPGDAEADVLVATLRAGRLEAMLDEALPDTFTDVEIRQVSDLGQSVLLLAVGGVTTADASKMRAAVDDVLDQIRRTPLSTADVRRAQAMLTTDLLRGAQRIEDRARMMQTYIANGHEPDWLDQDIARYEAVDSAAVTRFVQQQLTSEHRVVLTIFPRESSAP